MGLLRGDERGVSPVVGVVLGIVITVLLLAVVGATVFSYGERSLSTTAVHSQGSYEVAFTNDGEDALELQVRAFEQNAPETAFLVRVNHQVVHRWDGQEPLEMTCLYPGDHLDIISSTGGETYPVDEHYVERATDCLRYNTFPGKFKHAVVAGESHVVNDRYAFGLAIDPNGDAVAADGNGDNDMALGRVSLANPWHHVRKYDRRINGVEPPVFVVVMVDNVHWTDVPDSSTHSAVSPVKYYNWTDDPPESLSIGENAYSLSGSNIEIPPSKPATEPTNDVFMLFKPGCDGSKIVFLADRGGYANDIYLDGTKIIDDTNTATPGEVFNAPGVTCRGDTDWS